ncbi:hypothetical protein GEMRC1_013111 [Eukaryota sp. GEM-RC1]
MYFFQPFCQEIKVPFDHIFLQDPIVEGGFDEVYAFQCCTLSAVVVTLSTLTRKEHLQLLPVESSSSF